MSDCTHYDTLAIGTGEAAKFVCWTRSTAGKKTAIIEHKWFGGSCPNIACLPSKNFLHAAEMLHNTRKYASTGLLKVSGSSEVDMTVVRERKREMVKGLSDFHEEAFKESGTGVIFGHARFLSDKKVEVELQSGGKEVLTAENIIICTGSQAKIGDTPGLKEAKPLTHIEILEIDHVPKHLLILGGGYSGMEFAQAFRRFGAEVTVIERNERVLKNEDQDISSTLIEILKEEGVKFSTSTTISKVSGTSGESVTLVGTQEGKPFKITGSHLLVASGRIPNTADMGIETIGIELTSSGHVKVDEYLQTNIHGVFAAGDCAGSPYFTHMGFDDYRVIRDVLNKKLPPHTTKDRLVPYTLYTDPELAHVGLSEDAARKAGIQYRLGKIPMSTFLRSRTMDATQGFAKTLVSVTDDKILGFTALGPRAGEMLPAVSLAMVNGLGYTSLVDMITPHPTMCEGLVLLFDAVPPRS